MFFFFAICFVNQYKFTYCIKFNFSYVQYTMDGLCAFLSVQFSMVTKIPGNGNC